MRPHFWHGYDRRAAWGFLYWLFLLVTLWPVQGSEGMEGQTQATGQDGSVGWARVTVKEGRLSVDLREADIQTVLARIAGQAGISIRSGPVERRTISVEFTGEDLEQGIRRLLRLASLNYVILYSRGSEGAVAIQEVRVFGERTGEVPLQPIVAEREVEGSAIAEHEVKERVQDAGQRFSAALAQALSASRTPTEGEESEAARRFREALEGTREETSPVSKGMESEAVRRLREALQLK